jgi:hypothetical protein
LEAALKRSLAMTSAMLGLLCLSTPAWPQASSDSTERDVFGTLLLGFALSDSAVAPKPPFEISMQVDSRSGEQQTFRLKDPGATRTTELITTGPPRGYTAAIFGENFAISLVPGRYSITALLIKAPDLAGEKEITLPTSGPEFSVADDRCTYLGRVAQRYVRLPIGSARSEAMNRVSKRASEGFFFMHFDTGDLILPPEGKVDIPAASDSTVAGLRLYRHAKELDCTVQLASRAARPH